MLVAAKGVAICFPAVLLLAAMPAIAPGQAEPFGLRMGMSLAQVKRVTGAVADTGIRGFYHSERVPSPQPEFRSYDFMVSPSAGLCSVLAIGKTIRNDSSGTALRAEFDRLQEALDRKYGPHKHRDELKEGSIYTKPRQWMEGVYKSDRYFVSEWPPSLGTPDAKMPAPVQTVGMQAGAKDASTGELMVLYYFSNSLKCANEIQK